MRKLEGQRICVVGGTAGIGLALAREAISEGADVTITGRTAQKARVRADHLGERATGFALDILDPAAIAHFFDELGAIDHLVMTAAQVQGGGFADGDIGAARGSFEGKFWSQFLCARHARVQRSILFSSGVLSRRPWPGTSALAAANGAVEALGRALAVELAPIRVNVLSPGFVQGTEAYDPMTEAARSSMFSSAAARLPAGLVGNAESVAGPALSLLVSPYATGVVLDIDGGGLLS
jgi:NAD(P)-dependent dehydrogenase (short-subunit alcohol dehydrogenase family)